VKNLFLALLALSLAACGGKSETPAAGSAPASGATPTHLLAADLPGAVGVLAAKAGKAGDEVAVFGRVRKTATGVFTLVDDAAVSYCGHGDDPMDDCKTPWDYCCENQETVTQATLVVEASDAAGKPVAKDDLGIRPLDLVAVRGVLEQDADGILVLRAKEGWFRRERPPVGDDVRFP
jgi:hypothetical protein